MADWSQDDLHPDLPGTIAAYARMFETISPASVDEVRRLMAPDVHFKDPFSDVTGLDKTTRVFEKMFEDVDDVAFAIRQVAGSGRDWMLRWNFRCKAPVIGRLDFDGVSLVRLNEAGLIAEHIDYWDAAEQVYMRAPGLGLLLRGLRGRLGLRD